MDVIYYCRGRGSACSQILNCSSSERTGEDTEKEVAENESEKETAENGKANANILHDCSVELINVNSLQGPEQYCDDEVPESGESISKRCIDANISDKGLTGADSSNRKEMEVDIKEETDECCNLTDSNTKSLINTDQVISKNTSAEECQLSPNCSSKRQKKDDDSFGVPCPTSGGKNKIFGGPMKVYHHQKKKISAESIEDSSALTRCNVSQTSHTEFGVLQE